MAGCPVTGPTSASTSSVGVVIAVDDDGFDDLNRLSGMRWRHRKRQHDERGEQDHRTL